MRQYTLVHESNLSEVESRLPQETGETVETVARDPIYETRDVLDENGDPTGETYEVFVGFGEPYTVEVPEVQGGLCNLGKYEDFYYLLLTGSNATMVDLEKDYEANFVPIMKWPDADTFEDRKSTRMATNIRTKLNEWRVAKELEEYPASILNGEALQDTLNLIRTDINILEFSIMASKD